MSSKAQTQKNFVFNIITLAVNVAVGLFYTPYLVKSLGIVAYGVVPLALVINHYISVLSSSLTGTLTRFYSVAIGKQRTEEASRYLTSSFLALVVIIVFLTPLFVLLISNIDRVFNIPAAIVPSAKALFTFTIISFVLSLFSNLLNITLYARNRLDLMNLIKCTRILVRVSVTVFFLESIQKNIAYIGYANFITEAVVILTSVLLFRATADKAVRISFKYLEKAALVSVSTMTFWVIVHQVGDTGLYKIDNILVNKFWSTRESGILGAFTEFGTYVTSVVSIISTLFGPLILMAYSNGDHKKVKSLALDNSLLVGAVTALMIGVIIGFAEPIIRFWLGKEYASYSSWFILKQITLPFYAASGVYAFVYRAWNKLILPAILTLVIGLVNLGVSLTILNLGKGAEQYILYMLAASAVFIVIQSYFLNAYSFYRVYPEENPWKSAGIFLKILAVLLLTISASELYTHYIKVDSLMKLVVGVAIVAVFCASAVFLLIFNDLQRINILNFIKKLTFSAR